MRHNLPTKILIAVALLILTVPVGASAQVFRDRYNDRYDSRDQYDRGNRRELRGALANLENSSIQLQNDLNVAPTRRVLGIFQLRSVDNNAVAQVQDFRRAVRQLRNSSDNGRDLSRSAGEAQLVLERGVQLDRYLRLRTGSTRVDEDLSVLRSGLHTLADAYGLSVPH
jgi:hypothetical protein